jgi:hypothetical protein
MTKARLIIEDSGVLADGARWTIRIWLVPSPVPPSTHRYKYSLYYGYPGERVVGYDQGHAVLLWGLEPARLSAGGCPLQ